MIGKVGLHTLAVADKRGAFEGLEGVSMSPISSSANKDKNNYVITKPLRLKHDIFAAKSLTLTFS